MNTVKIKIINLQKNSYFTNKLFAIGETVPISGLYVCDPCGYTQQFLAGQAFPTCEACLAGTEYGPQDYQEFDVEFWSLVS